MVTRLKLHDGRKVAVEQTMTGITARVDGGEPKPITSQVYMSLVMAGTPIGDIE